MSLKNRFYYFVLGLFFLFFTFVILRLEGFGNCYRVVIPSFLWAIYCLIAAIFGYKLFSVF